MGLIGWLIVGSLIIAFVFGWEFMIALWTGGFEWIQDMAGAMLAQQEGHENLLRP